MAKSGGRWKNHVYVRIFAQYRFERADDSSCQISRRIGDHFVLAPGLDSCLCIYTMEHWNNLISKFEQMSATHQNVRKVKRYLIGKGSEMECDKQGRILIPAHLRKLADLKDARIIGAGSTIEIWDPELLDRDLNEEESITDLAESLELPLNF